MVEPISAGIIAGGSLLSGLLGAGASMGSAYQQYKYQRKLQEQSAGLNYKYNKKLTKWQSKNLPGLNRQGLESAGYNPLLALSGGYGSSGTSASFTGTGNASAPDFSQALNSALDWANYYKDKKEVESRIENNNQDTKLKDQQALNIMEDTYAKDVQNQLVEQSTKANLDYQLIMNRLTVAQAVRQELENGNLPKFYEKQLKVLESEIYSNLYGSGAQQTSASAQMTNAITGQKELNARMPGIQAENTSRQWEADHPYQSRLINSLPGAVSGLAGATILSGPGYMGLLNKGGSAVKNYKNSVPYRTHNRYPGY